jgi:nicotinate dehydrogenase subunit B
LNHGIGFAFARYKNLASYCAIACEVAVQPDTGSVRLLHAVAAIDSGEVVNPDGIRNQTEGGFLQSTSWTLYEAVQFDRTRLTTSDWAAAKTGYEAPPTAFLGMLPKPQSSNNQYSRGSLCCCQWRAHCSDARNPGLVFAAL